MNENILFRFGPLSLTRFGLWIGLGALLWMGSAGMVRAWKYRKMPAGTVWFAAFCMIALGAVCSRALYCAVNFDRYAAGSLFRMWEGGMSMCGALAGAFAGLWLASGIAKVKTGRLANCFGPGIGLFGACAVMAQRAIGEGWGKVAEAAWVAESLLGVVDLYGDIRYAVFRVELIGCALTFLAGLLPLLRRRPARFSAFGWGWGVYAAMRIVTASMREGAILRVEYFRIEQIAGVAILLIIALCRLACDLRAGAGAKRWIPFILFLIGAGICVWMEFAVDREGYLEEKYALMAIGALLCLLGALPRREKRQGLRPRTPAKGISSL